MDASILEACGLTRHESIVYLTLVRTGNSSAGEVLKNSGLNTGKIYETLESLKRKGLVSESVINNTRVFSAFNSSQFLEYVRAKQEELRRNEQKLLELLPEIEKMREGKLKNTLPTTFQGFKGISLLVKELLAMLARNDEILILGVSEKMGSRYRDFWDNTCKAGEEKGIYIKRIFSENGIYFNSQKNSRYCQGRILDGVSSVTTATFGKQHLLIFNYMEPEFCTVFKDVQITAFYRNTFANLWKISGSGNHRSH